MSKSKRQSASKKQARRAPEDPQQFARYLADAYFDALASNIPSDAPGEVDLIIAATELSKLIAEIDRDRYADPSDLREMSDLRAGYLLGVEIGRRLGGAR